MVPSIGCRCPPITRWRIICCGGEEAEIATAGPH
jgi:hypothetical protein